MSKEIRKVAQMLVGISSEYLAGKIEEDVFKVQIEFANDILNKAENLPISDVSFSLDDLKSFFSKGYKAGIAEALSKPQDILPSYEQHIDYEVGKIIHSKKPNES
jgi:hypothetical protein